jgi:CubicO group peptidase (beta-lactamase class C family)
MRGLETAVGACADETRFSGVVRVDRAGETVLCRAYGPADRRWQVGNDVDTQFGIASGTKGLTAMTVISLIEEGALELGTPARAVLGSDLPLIGDDVTVEHLLSHRSGIGDYLDEDVGVDVRDHVLTIPVHGLATTEQYLAVLDGHRTKFPAGERFAYSNSGFVVLALIAERVAGVPFHDLVAERVCRPAGMHRTAFLRSDELPGGAATGYLEKEGLRTNVLHLPVRGSGDGGIYTTAADVHALWAAFLGGRIVSPEWVAEMVRPRGEMAPGSRRYGLGIWLHPTADRLMLEGSDPGVSFRSVHDRSSGITHTVLSNTTDGAWPIARHLDEALLRVNGEG